ncbi:MAG: hypothetical protein K2K38_00705 [Clostridia bacterium]|nr:hypothetical protein [Clostridia bacterium]
MAEERLIDDDKDRKYKIVKNADGEDELVIDDTQGGEEPAEELGFEVPELDSDDEEAAIMTPEQLAARAKMREEEEAVRQEKLSKIAEHAASLLAEKKYEDASYVLAQADELGGNGEIYALKLRTVTLDFTHFTNVEEGAEVVNGVKKFTPKERVEELAPVLPSLKAKAEELKKEVAALDSENEEKKSERRVVFKRKRNNSVICFALTVVPLIIFAALAIYYGTNLTAVKGGANIPLFIAFVSIAGVMFIATVITAKFLWKNVNNLKLNEKNSATKLGRELEEKKAELNFVESISEIFVKNDIS